MTDNKSGPVRREWVAVMALPLGSASPMAGQAVLEMPIERGRRSGDNSARASIYFVISAKSGLASG